jgi:hypothetical protein
MVAAARPWLYAPFPAPHAPKNKLGQVRPARKVDIQKIDCSRSASNRCVRDSLRCPVNGAASRVSLLSVPSGFNSLQIRCVLIVISFSPCP